MITKEEKIKIFEDTILGLRKKFISDKEWSDIQELEDDRLLKSIKNYLSIEVFVGIHAMVSSF